MIAVAAHVHVKLQIIFIIVSVYQQTGQYLGRHSHEIFQGIESAQLSKSGHIYHSVLGHRSAPAIFSLEMFWTPSSRQEGPDFRAMEGLCASKEFAL